MMECMRLPHTSRETFLSALRGKGYRIDEERRMALLLSDRLEEYGRRLVLLGDEDEPEDWVVVCPVTRFKENPPFEFKDRFIPKEEGDDHQYFDAFGICGTVFVMSLEWYEANRWKLLCMKAEEKFRRDAEAERARIESEF